MSLLVVRDVTKRYTTGRLEKDALRNVSLEVEAAELVGVWGLRRSGRSTLLRVAAGLDLPDEGTVHFNGRNLARDGGSLGRGIAFANPHFIPTQGGSVVDQVAVGLLAHGVSIERARARAYEALERVDATLCADVEPRLLDPSEVSRVALARAIVTEPDLLLVDDPINGVDLLQRDPIIDVIRSVADGGTAVLMTVGDVVTVADRMLSIDDGELRGDLVPEPARVVHLRPPRAQSSA